MGTKDPANPVDAKAAGEGPSFPCRTCGKPALVASKTFPFCSDRCRWVDLGHWMAGDYRIPDRGPVLDTTDEPDAGEPEDED